MSRWASPVSIAALVFGFLALALLLFPPFQNKSITYFTSKPRNTSFVLSPPSDAVDGVPGLHGGEARLASNWEINTARWGMEFAILISVAVTSVGLVWLLRSRRTRERHDETTD